MGPKTKSKKMATSGNPSGATSREDAIRQFILDRCEALFIAHGYHKTSMDMIALECGLSKPTLYNYFKNKYEMFTSLYVRLYLSLYEAFKSILSQKRSRRHVLESMIHRYFSIMTSKKEFLKMYFREQHLVIHENIEEHMTWHVQSRKKMEEMLTLCLEHSIRPEIAKRFSAAMVASTLFDILEGMVSNLILHEDQDPVQEKQFILELLDRGVLGKRL